MTQARHAGMFVLVMWMSLAGCQKPPATPATNAAPISGPWNLPGKPPHLIAHYMPWFTVADPAWDHWRWNGPGTSHNPEQRLGDGRRDIASVNYPLIGPYDSRSRNVIRYHLKTAKAAGIEAFACIWYGPGSSTDRCIATLLDEADAVGMQIAICYEEKLNFPDYRRPTSRRDAIDTATADLLYILTQYGSHPAYLKRNGMPFIFQFNAWGTSTIGPNTLMPSEWEQVFRNLPSPVVYGRQNVDEHFYPRLQGAYQWWSPDEAWLETTARRAAELRAAGRLTFFMSMVCPGFDDSGVSGWTGRSRVTPRNEMQTLRMTFSHALSGEPELVQIVTWNDFNEGTVVEPTRADGFKYLDEIATWWSQQTRRRVDLPAIREPFLEYARSATPPEQAELPPLPYTAYLTTAP